MEPRVLSIQSHVVRGYVGNKSTTFPLQLHGIEVDAINSVQFSMHTFYKDWRGTVMNVKELQDLFESLESNKLLGKYTHLLTGYCRDTEFLSKIAEFLKTLRAANPNLKYICDPVLGDRGKYYVPEEVMPIYRDQLAPLADVIVPNQFELGQLTSLPVTCESEIITAIDALHDRGLRRIVVTSTDIGENDAIMNVYSSEKGENETSVTRHRYTILRFAANFVGTGDLFSASLLVWLRKTENNLCLSVQMVLRTMHHILQNTLDYAKRVTPNGEAVAMSDLELRFIHHQDILMNPPHYDLQVITL